MVWNRLNSSLIPSLLILVAAISWCATGARAQEHSHAGGEPPSIPVELLQRPVTLREGVGVVNDPVTTSSKDAQAFYNQGVAYLHSYSWIEAARSFVQALRHDNKIAMAYVGLSRALSGLNVSAAARATLEQAEGVVSHAGKREQRRVELRRKQLDAMADPSNTIKHQTYKQALDEALAVYPGDVELWLLRGNAEEATAAGRGQHGAAGSIKFYEKGLELSPNHLAAHHYLTHSLENTGRIDEALKHGERYARLAPAVPHARHMYGHDLRRVGRIKEAISEFVKADELEQAYYKAENIPPEYDWHHEHNLDLLSTSYQHQGQMKAAEKLMRQAFEIPSMMDTLEFNKKQLPEFLLCRGRAEEALAAASRLTKSRWDIVRAIGRVMASRALMAMNRIKEAGQQAEAARREVQGKGERAEFLAPYLEAAEGELLLRSGQLEKGRAALKAVVGRLRAEAGPDAWTQALFRLETIARVAREAGDWEMAEHAARQMIDHDAAYAGSHYAMALVAERKGDAAGALSHYRAVEKYWGEADPDLIELQQARAKLAALRK
jgi:tetratricopeptide (TPR) repeat protein